jgi:hypothetical protein
MPPHGRPSLRIVRAICDSLSKSSPSTIETSSIMSTLVLNQRFLALVFRRIFLTSSGTSSLPKPIPAKLCNVMPPILQAASPVEAVMLRRSGSRAHLFFKAAMMERIKTDLPVPAGPVKKTLCLSSITISCTCCCSALRDMAACVTLWLVATAARISSMERSV